MSRRVILVTGGTGKLGKLFTSHFLSKGDIVVATGRSESSLDGLREFVSYNENLKTVIVDFEESQSVKNLVVWLKNEDLMPEGLINNARSLDSLEIGDKGVISRENFLKEYLIDVVAPYELTMELVHSPESKLKNVVNIGSQYGVVAANPVLYTEPLKQSAIHYGVAKAALGHLTKELSVRLADSGVKVNCIAYGGIEGRVDEDFKKRYAALCPLGRMLTEEEVSGPMDYLMSPSSSGMTGQIVSVDGGWSVW